MALTLASTITLSSGYTLPLLGLGVYQNKHCFPAVLAALRRGYRHIDTAQMYRNEAEVGRAIKAWSEESRSSTGADGDVDVDVDRRGEVFVTTKVIQGSHGYESTLGVVEESLSKLGTSYIDLYLIHSPLSGKTKRLETYRALLDKQKEGKIRSVGVSNYGVKHLEEIREAGYPTPTVNQIELHPLCQQRPIVQYCTEHNIVVSVYCPILRGDFSNPVIQEVSQKISRPPSQILLRWSLQHGFVPLPKSSHPERVVANADLYDFELSEEDMERLDALDRGKEGAVSWNPVDAE